MLTDISGRISHWYRPVLSVADVLLHIPGDRLHVRSGIACWDAVDHFVARKEKEQICVLLEHINSGEDALEVDMVV